MRENEREWERMRENEKGKDREWERQRERTRETKRERDNARNTRGGPRKYINYNLFYLADSYPLFVVTGADDVLRTSRHLPGNAYRLHRVHLVDRGRGLGAPLSRLLSNWLQHGKEIMLVNYYTYNNISN